MVIGKYLKAYDDFSKVIEYCPKDAEAYFKRAIVNYCLENDDASKHDLLKAESLDLKYSEEYFWSQFSKLIFALISGDLNFSSEPEFNVSI